MKRLFLKLAATGFGVIVALLLGEVVLRVYFSLSQPQPITYTANSRGFRDGEHPLAKKAGVLRIAFQGDSYTYGSGVEVQDRFSDRTGALLSARLSGRQIEILNFGRPGLNIAYDLESLQKNVLPFDPDIIVFGLVLNDFDTPNFEMYMFAEMRNDEAPHKWLAGLEHYSKLALFIDRISVNLFSNSRRIHIRFLNNIWSPRMNPYYDRMRHHLYNLVEIISKRKGIVVFFPYFVSADEKELPFYKTAKRIVAETCRTHGCRFLEVLPLLRHKSFRHWWVSPEDHHPNAEAQAIVARAIADAIAETL